MPYYKLLLSAAIVADIPVIIEAKDKMEAIRIGMSGTGFDWDLDDAESYHIDNIGDVSDSYLCDEDGNLIDEQD